MAKTWRIPTSLQTLGSYSGVQLAVYNSLLVRGCIDPRIELATCTADGRDGKKGRTTRKTSTSLPDMLAIRCLSHRGGAALRSAPRARPTLRRPLSSAAPAASGEMVSFTFIEEGEVRLRLERSTASLATLACAAPSTFAATCTHLTIAVTLTIGSSPADAGGRGGGCCWPNHPRGGARKRRGS